HGQVTVDQRTAGEPANIRCLDEESLGELPADGEVHIHRVGDLQCVVDSVGDSKRPSAGARLRGWKATWAWGAYELRGNTKEIRKAGRRSRRLHTCGIDQRCGQAERRGVPRRCERLADQIVEHSPSSTYRRLSRSTKQ